MNIDASMNMDASMMMNNMNMDTVAASRASVGLKKRKSTKSSPRKSSNSPRKSSKSPRKSQNVIADADDDEGIDVGGNQWGRQSMAM